MAEIAEWRLLIIGAVVAGTVVCVLTLIIGLYVIACRWATCRLSQHELIRPVLAGHIP